MGPYFFKCLGTDRAGSVVARKRDCYCQVSPYPPDPLPLSPKPRSAAHTEKPKKFDLAQGSQRSELSQHFRSQRPRLRVQYTLVQFRFRGRVGEEWSEKTWRALLDEVFPSIVFRAERERGRDRKELIETNKNLFKNALRVSEDRAKKEEDGSSRGGVLLAWKLRRDQKRPKSRLRFA